MEEIKEINKSLLVITICNLLLFGIIFFQLIQDNKRLNAHKEVITLLNEKNDNLSTRLELLTENQIMIYKKVKKYERKTKIK